MVATLPETEEDEPILFYYASEGRDEGDGVVGALWDDADTVRRRYVRRYGRDPRYVMAVTFFDERIGEFHGYIVWEAGDDACEE